MTAGKLRFIDRDLVAELHAKAVTSPRLRTHYNLHASHEEPIHRMCMAMEPGTYIRPHRHPDKWELLLIVSGEMLVLTFDAAGKVLTRTLLSAGGYTYGVESPAGTWHAVATLAPSTVVFECKAGPYVPTPEQDFAPWAPPEGHAHAAEFERWYKTAQPGDRPPAFP
ncbi:MAG TPA: WbuC family cupin fold metalloprotein [Gammaproteobacteria bacterium]|nr:WbuC family cupin fold metalloprotein [Gammaproteobacteria bacterium]